MQEGEAEGAQARRLRILMGFQQGDEFLDVPLQTRTKKAAQADVSTPITYESPKSM